MGEERPEQRRQGLEVRSEGGGSIQRQKLQDHPDRCNRMMLVLDEVTLVMVVVFEVVGGP